MTKFILVGGYVQKAKDEGKAFCEEVFKGFDSNKPVRILDCVFARPQDSWLRKIQEDKEFFSKFVNNFELELASVDNFVDQVKNSEVVFFRGGDTDVLFDILNNISGWQDAVSGKVIVGTSAGAEVFTKYVYNIDYLVLRDYLGVLPIKFIPHWKSDYNAPNVNWDEAYEELKNYKEDLPIYTLKEGEFVVFSQ